MSSGPAWLSVAARHRGFALLIVLWTLVLIAFIVGQVTAAGRTEIRIAGNLAANAAAQVAADGAIYQAIFALADPQPDRRWAPDGSAHQLQIGRSRITLQINDESERINPNLASPALLEGLLRAVGGPPEIAAALAAAIGEWVGSTQIVHPPAEIVAEYQAAGLDYGPPGSPLESIDELGRVRGMTPALLDALRPHLTLFGPAKPTASADGVVSQALALSGELSPAIGQAAAGSGAAGMPDLITARIRATHRVPETLWCAAPRSCGSARLRARDTRRSPGTMAASDRRSPD